MASVTLYRLGGLALLAGGVIGAIGLLLHPAAMTDARWDDSHLLIFFGLLLLLLGLPAAYARQAARAGVLGLVGVVLLWFGLPFTDLVHAVVGFTVVPLLNADPSTQVLLAPAGPMETMAFHGWMGILNVASVPLLLVGIPLFPIATLRARILPRWPALVLLVSPLFLIASFALPSLRNAAPAVVYLALGGFGYVLLTERSAARQPTLAPIEAPSGA